MHLLVLDIFVSSLHMFCESFFFITGQIAGSNIVVFCMLITTPVTS